ncbi:MAG: TolC family protein [Lewinella sp.]|jgi:outer membrane protein TolC|uniref:TolC family protein n=1 Tax=Lewinella sp. TaxID=2004506 RepID=UPI003D6B26AF
MRNRIISSTYLVVAALLLVFYPAKSQVEMSLTTAIAKAMESSVKITNSELEVEAANVVKQKAAAYYYPQVNFDGVVMHAIDPLLEISSPGGNLPVYDGNPANLASATQFAYTPPSQIGLLQKIGVASLSASQPIYTGGKIKVGNKLADVGVAIREEQKYMAENELRLTTEQQYWQIVALQEKQKTIDGFRKLLDRLSIQVDDAYKAGLSIRNDVYKLELEQSQLKLNENKLHNGKALALMQFCNTIGEDFDSTLFLLDHLDNFEPPAVYLQVGIDYLSNLPEVRLLEKSVEVQALQSELKNADYKPTVAVGVNAFFLTQFEEQTSAVNAFGFASVSVPLTPMWMGKHDLEEQLIKEKISRNTLEDTKALLELRAAKSWTDLKEAYAEIQIMQERIEQATENLRVNQTSFDSGVVTLSELLEAKALQTEALDKMIEAKTKYKITIATYLQHVGK